MRNFCKNSKTTVNTQNLATSRGSWLWPERRFPISHMVRSLRCEMWTWHMGGFQRLAGSCSRWHDRPELWQIAAFDVDLEKLTWTYPVSPVFSAHTYSPHLAGYRYGTIGCETRKHWGLRYLCKCKWRTLNLPRTQPVWLISQKINGPTVVMHIVWETEGYKFTTRGLMQKYQNCG